MSSNQRDSMMTCFWLLGRISTNAVLICFLHKCSSRKVSEHICGLEECWAAVSILMNAKQSQRREAGRRAERPLRTLVETT